MTQTLFESSGASPAVCSPLSDSTLSRAGATRLDDGAYRLNGFHLRIEGDDWLRLTNLKWEEGQVLHGPWKPGTDGRPVCDVPWLRNGCFSGTDAAAGVIQFLQWASERAASVLSPERGDVTWSPPQIAIVQEALQGCAMDIEVRGLTRRIEMVHEPNQLALRCNLAGIATSLDRARRAVLGGVVADANERWRMARMLLDGEGVAAEVDLSGLPAQLLERSRVIRLAHQCLSAVVSATVECIALLADSATQVSLCSFLVERAPEYSSLFLKEVLHEERNR